MANPTPNPASCTDRRRIGAALVATLLSVLCCIATPLRAQTVPLEAVVAVVDDDIVLASEYQARLKQVTENLQRQKVQQMPPQEVLARQVLDRLILERIQLQMAERAGVQISDSQLNEAIGTMAAQNGLTLEQFKTSLESQGESYMALRNQVRQEMTLQRVQQGNVRSRIQVTEQEVTDFLASEEGQKRTSAVYHIAHLLLPLPEGATLDDEHKAKDYIERLRAGLLEGDTFERFVRNPDKSQYAFTGGDLGWRPAADLPGIFADAVPKLEVHAVSDPVRSPSGLHLVKLLDKRGGAGQIMQRVQQAGAARQFLIYRPGADRMGDDAFRPGGPRLLDMAHGVAFRGAAFPTACRGREAFVERFWRCPWEGLHFALPLDTRTALRPRSRPRSSTTLCFIRATAPLVLSRNCG